MPRTISSELRRRFQYATTQIAGGSTSFLDQDVDRELRSWLDGDDEPLPWQYPNGVTPDEYFFITTLYGNMNLGGQRTMIRKFFVPLFVRAAKRDIRNFLPDLPDYAGLRSNWMKVRLCTMGSLLRDRGISMQEYVGELRNLERNATSENPTPALDRITRDHAAKGVKTLSVFVRDCVGGNCFPIDLRVQKQLDRYRLPLDEKLLVRMCLDLKKNPRELARAFYEVEGISETSQNDLVNLVEPESCVFSTSGRDCWWRDAVGKLIREPNLLKFDVLSVETGEWEACTMMLEKDGLYHWRDCHGQGHWWGFLSETVTHAYLTANFINPDGSQGVQIFIWPKP